MLHPSQAGGGAVFFFLFIGISLKQCAQPFPVDVVVTHFARNIRNSFSGEKSANTQKYMEIP